MPNRRTTSASLTRTGRLAVADQILHAIWRSELSGVSPHINRDGSYSFGVGPSITFSADMNLDKARSRVKFHHRALVYALWLERFFSRETEEADEWVEKMADLLYRQSLLDDRPWFEVEEDDPQLAESFRRMARLTRDIALGDVDSAA